MARAASAPGATPQMLDGPTAALLSAVDGTRTVPELVARAWGEPQGADPADLIDQALMRLDKLSRAGLVEL